MAASVSPSSSTSPSVSPSSSFSPSSSTSASVSPSASASPSLGLNPYDADYVKASVLAAYQKRANYREQAKAEGWLDQQTGGDGPGGEIYATTPREEILDYYMVKIIGRDEGWGSRHPNLKFVGPSVYGWSEEDDFYWERRILFPWLFVAVPTPGAPRSAEETLATETAAAVVAAAAAAAEPPALSLSQEAAQGIVNQGGLLQDDLMYNLSLLCANVLAPFKKKYPNMVVVSGLRQLNTGMSQHETGEAADIQINGQTDAMLYEAADYIAKSLQFDQLVLNYNVTPTLSWIHVSFNAQGLRRLVLTRDHDDTYHEGLYLIKPLTGEARATAERQLETDIAAVDAELSILSKRDALLTPKVRHAELPADEDDTGLNDTEPPPP